MKGWSRARASALRPKPRRYWARSSTRLALPAGAAASASRGRAVARGKRGAEQGEPILGPAAGSRHSALARSSTGPYPGVETPCGDGDRFAHCLPPCRDARRSGSCAENRRCPPRLRPANRTGTGPCASRTRSAGWCRVRRPKSILPHGRAGPSGHEVPPRRIPGTFWLAVSTIATARSVVLDSERAHRSGAAIEYALRANAVPSRRSIVAAASSFLSSVGRASRRSDIDSDAHAGIIASSCGKPIELVDELGRIDAVAGHTASIDGGYGGARRFEFRRSGRRGRAPARREAVTMADGGSLLRSDRAQRIHRQAERGGQQNQFHHYPHISG